MTPTATSGMEPTPTSDLSHLRGMLVDNGPCPYLPDRQFRSLVVDTDFAQHYRALMDLRFRRSGTIAYMPMCERCSACVPIRIDVRGFRPARDQQRCAARNRDLVVTFHERSAGDTERVELWQRYQREIHGQSDPQWWSPGDGGVPGGELQARDAQGRLLAVSEIDVIGDALSSVYCYWDPEHAARSLGTFMALAELEHAARWGLRWWYLGFAVDGCAKMAYKRRYQPQQVLRSGHWVAVAATETALPRQPSDPS